MIDLKSLITLRRILGGDRAGPECVCVCLEVTWLHCWSKSVCGGVRKGLYKGHVRYIYVRLKYCGGKLDPRKQKNIHEMFFFFFFKQSSSFQQNFNRSFNIFF